VEDQTTKDKENNLAQETAESAGTAGIGFAEHSEMKMTGPVTVRMSMDGQKTVTVGGITIQCASEYATLKSQLRTV
jgi:hypothetical protein